ncbi:MAG: hypothetical protein ACI915_003826 [Gammaproteobacteria bacterium]|jgi:hypothetical protein
MGPFDLVQGTPIARHISNSEPDYAIPTTDLPTSFEGLIIGPGEYVIYDNFRFSDLHNQSTADLDALRLDYTFEFNVATVPLPASLIMLTPALLLLRAKRGFT